MEFFFDTETTGLPERSGNRYASYKKLEKYDKSRIVSISWIVTQQHKVVNQSHFIVKPDGFIISEESIRIHGITNEFANENGCEIRNVFETLKSILPNCSTLIAHNIDFDINILQSELYRYGYIDIVEEIGKKNKVCTMKKGKDVMKSRAYPKLGALYQFLYGDQIQNAHDSQYDTYYCYKCYISMFPSDKSVFFFGDRPVKLTDIQKDIVYEDADKNILVIACAGAGKTLTVICRVKQLLESGVDEHCIMMTTFTRDAANDMKNKLFDILGYKPNITVGTIDSIAKKYSEKSCEFTENKLTKTSIKDVSEYGHNFLAAISNNPDIISKYKYLFVDEFQDINDVQFNIIRTFYNNGCKIFAVGDDAQNIYTFRGSKIEFILNFEKYFNNSCRKFLMENFRSTNEIISIANACMDKNENNIPKKMYSGITNNGGKKPIVRYFENAVTQNNTIVNKIKEILKDGCAEHDIVVLSPVNQPLYMIEELLTKQDIKNVYLDGKCDVKTSKKPWHICLSTIHKSKGLEWDYVFMINMSDEIIPKTKTPVLIEESRRLFYVGITRARKELHIYYTVMITQQPFVTRFISELDKTLYITESMEEKCFGLSELDIIPLELSVTKLIENLDGEDYIKMKELGILPLIEKKAIPKQKIYESFGYAKVIENNDLYSDFGIFIEKLIKRNIGSLLGDNEICQDKHTLMCIANVKLDPIQYSIYFQYKNNFKENMKRIKPLLIDIHGNKHRIKYILEQNSKFITENHMPTILNIIWEIRKKTEYFNIEPDKVPLFSKSFLPQGFEVQLEKCLRNFRDVSAPININDIWEIAKCKKIVLEYRRRLLYKNVSLEDLSEYDRLYENISKSLMDFLLIKMNSLSDIHTEEDFEIKEGIFGEVDLRINDIIIDYKTSINDEISLQWLLQLLCYKTLADLNGKKINKIGILNALRGWYSELDVSDWNKHYELVKYLLQKREEKMRLI
jgi:DNA polymerase III epsilon subunit-like protein